MDKKMIKFKLIVARGKCSTCGFERILYFTPDNTYGERIVSTKDGKYCAYADLFNENVIQELEKYCINIFLAKGTNVSTNKLKRMVTNIYGITCDNINGEQIDTLPNGRCTNCLEGRLEENKEFGEKLMEIEVPNITHYKWEILDEEMRNKEVNRELIRQGYVI